MFPVEIKFNNKSTKVSDSGSLNVIPEWMGEGTPGRSPKRTFMNELVSTGAGVTNMNVNGSAAPVNYAVQSNQEYDKRIHLIQIVMIDVGITEKDFGGVTGPLPNGFDLFLQQNGEDNIIINKAKSTAEMRIKTYNPYLEPTIINNFVGTSDGIVFHIPTEILMPGGFLITKGTKDQLRAVINDDLTGMSTFEVRAIGYKHYN